MRGSRSASQPEHTQVFPERDVPLYVSPVGTTLGVHAFSSVFLKCHILSLKTHNIISLSLFFHSVLRFRHLRPRVCFGCSVALFIQTLYFSS